MVVARAADALAKKSSRRQFFKFMTATSLGTGLYLTRSGVSLGGITACAGCGGPTCDCGSPHPTCSNCPGPICGGGGGGCPSGCTNTGEWYCCINGCVKRCSECDCGTCCHCFILTGATCGGACPC